MSRRPLLVVYDVSDDVRRARVTDALSLVARHVQQSAWTLPAGTTLGLHPLVQGLGSLLAREDRVWAYQPCSSCLLRSLWRPAWLTPFAPHLGAVVIDPVTGGDGSAE